MLHIKIYAIIFISADYLLNNFLIGIIFGLFSSTQAKIKVKKLVLQLNLSPNYSSDNNLNGAKKLSKKSFKKSE